MGLLDLYSDELIQAAEQAPAPLQAPARRPSAWDQVSEFAKAPFKGIGQAALETGRHINAVTPMQAGNPLAMSSTEQESLLQSENVTRQGQDQALRSGIHALRPDPFASNTASLIMQDASRLLAKVGIYSATGGFAGAVGGTGLDEGITGYNELRDRGVDTGTAAKVGAVRGVSTAIGVALPAVGKTALQTVGLVVAGGPASFMTEQALTREILTNAKYPELAKEHDPFDPVGLGVSLAIPGVVGAALHRAKVRGEKKIDAAAKADSNPIANAPELAPAPAMTDTMGVRDAAHALYRQQTLEAHALADGADIAARDAHVNAFDHAANALDDGRPVQISDMQLNPAKAQAVFDEMSTRLRKADLEIASTREAVPSLLASAEVPTTSRPVPRRSDRLSFDLDPIMEEAQRLLLREGKGGFSGDILDELKAAGVKVSAETQNMMVGLQEFQHRMPELLQEISAVDWKSSGSKKPFDVIADAVERLRSGAQVTPADTAAGRAMKVAREMPDLPVRMDDDGAPAMAARDVLINERENRSKATSDAKAYAAAVECFLRTGL